jgi:predicted HAD superfamily phosphohydrolase YqeG
MKNKKKLLEVLKHPLGKIILVDLDNTLCVGTYWVGDEKHPHVNEKMAEFIRSLDDKGAFIVIWTARPIVLMTKTYKWLAANNINYPLAFRLKPPCDLMIDDKCLNIDDIK